MLNEHVVDYGPLLEDIDPPYRGGVTNIFLRAVRSGVTDPAQVVLYVRALLAQGLLGSQSREQLAEALHYDRDSAGALQLARWAVWWESLHPAVQAQIKLARRQPWRASR